MAHRVTFSMPGRELGHSAHPVPRTQGWERGRGAPGVERGQSCAEAGKSKRGRKLG
jgi:hypothetical protein